MALNKRDRFSFRWSKSELPDSDDINTQVLLLGITRFETTPSPAPAKKPLPIIASSSYGGNAHRLTHRDDHNDDGHCPSYHSSSIGSADLATYQSIEQLNKTTGCFPLERHRSKKHSSISGKVPLTIVANNNCVSQNNRQQIDQKSHRNHFDRLFERFQLKRIPNKSTGVNQTKRKNSIEQKAFYRWLHLSRNKRLERNIKCLDDDGVGYDDWHSLRRTPVIRKCSTKSNSIRRKTTKKSNKKSKKSSSRFSNCIPYCVTISASTTAVAASASSRDDSFAGNSVASSHRYTEYYCKKRSGTLSAAASNAADRHRLTPPPPQTTTTTTSNDCLMHYSHCKSNKHFRASNKNTDNNHNNNCSLFNNLNIMDRSVDSIGSCSLDVDAESTDFSDTSGSLNVCTPLSGKDFTREFTSRIHERCQFPNRPLSGQQKLQQTKTVLDPNSGKISTILSPQNVPPIVNSPTSPVKKPSYLNLACCVNGYSNLTTYDSKFRQSINKSREVSPIRPITYAVQYNRNGNSDNNYLSVPAPVPINDNNTNTNTNSNKNINNKINFMMDAHSILAPEKRYFSTTTQQKTIEINGTSHDVTDNVNSNGCAKFFSRSMLQNTTTASTTTTNGTGNTSLALVRDVNQEFDANGKGMAKSFIQQRVERLYGPGAVTQGLYSPKKPKSDDNQETTTTRTTQISTVLVEKSQNTTFQSTKYVLEAQRNGHLNNGLNRSAIHDDENINLNSLNEALPVLRHLRPEFRAQLPTLSPKRTIAISKLTPTSTAAEATTAASVTTTQTTLAQTQQSQYTNGGTVVNGKLNISTNILNNVNKQVLNGGVVMTSTPSLSTNNIENENDDDEDDDDDDDDDNSNRSTLDMQSQKKSLSASNAPTNNTTKNGCLTSNKSHDIEIVDSRQIELTTKGINTVVIKQLNTQNKSNLLPTHVDKTNDINKMASESKDFHIESSSQQNPMKIDQSSIVGDTVNDGDSIKLAVNNTTTSVETMDANGNHKTDQKKDGLYYLNVVQSERDRLLDLAITAEKELDQLLEKGDIDEEVLGHLRSAAGKARLLATKKFKQFEGLCNDNINQTKGDMPPPTPADLQGFWEMVLLQVDNVDSLYADIDKMRANGWKKPVQVKPKQPQGSKLSKRPLAGAKSSASSATTTGAQSSGAIKKSVADAKREAVAQKREAQRKQLAEMRRKNKLAMTAANSTDNIIVDQVIEDVPARQSNNEEINTENETDRCFYSNSKANISNA